MKILMSVTFAWRIAALCLLAGFVLGLYMGTRATSDSDPASGAAVTGHESSLLLVHSTGREVLPWRRTPSSSFSTGFSAS